MAYDTSIDYSAANAELKKQLAAATDAATKAAIQAQIDANTGSRTEKMASDLTKYGKYATDSELDSAAGIMANNQIGTGYEIQKTNLNTSYDNAKQNANNDALSRGMARSSFVSDRMANLDTSRANALTQVDASKALAINNAKTGIIDNYRTNTANALNNEKAEFADTIGAYSDNYQLEIDKVQGDGDPSNDWKVPYLNQARNLKIDKMKADAEKAGGSYSYNGGVDDTPKDPDPKPLFGGGQQSELYAGALNDSAASQAVGMNRTATGQLATIQRLFSAGQITEAQAQALIQKFNLG